MRILILSQYFWPETFRITEVAGALRDAGAEVVVLTGQPNYPDGVIAAGYRAASIREERHDGITIHRVPLVPRGRGGALRLSLNYLSFVVSASVLGPWLLRKREVDVVLVYAPSPILQAIPGVLLSRVKSAPLVTWVQDLWPESLAATGFVRDARLLRAVGWLVSWIYRRCDLILAQSRAFVASIAARAGSVPVRYFPNPGERAFDASAAASSGGPPEQGFAVVFAGNLGTVQALDTIVEAAAQLRTEPEVRFVIVGSGSRADWMRDEVVRRGLTNVLFMGRRPPEEMPAILRQAAVLLVSLARDPILSQTVPSKVQAYLAAGRPILAALDGEGARVVMEAGAGLTSPAEDATALAEAVRALRALGPEELEHMGARGRAYYQREYAPDVLAGRLLGLLAQGSTAAPMAAATT